MMPTKQVWLLFILFIELIILPQVLCNFNPYEVLGVKKNASQDQIKRAYRDLARKLHPDKSNLKEEEAERRFIELNRAFEILKDSSRRLRYDQNGETEDNRHAKGYHPSSRYRGRYRQTRGDWVYGNGGYTFTFTSSSGNGQLTKRSINAKQYHDEYIKLSETKAFLLFVYRDFCTSCFMIETTWMKIIDELSKHNVGFFSLNYDQEHKLSQELGVNSVPFIACLIDGQIHRYHNTEISLPSLVRFMKHALPENLVTDLASERDLERFIALGPQNSRLSAIFFTDKQNLNLRVLLLAFELRQYYRFGHVSTKSPHSHTFLKEFNLHSGAESHLLVFDEIYNKPAMHLRFKMDSVDTSHLGAKLKSWPFPRLPRISSQSKFDQLCSHTIPRGWDRTTKRLCVILFAKSSATLGKERKKMIEFISLNKLERDQRVVFAYIDPSKQANFATELILETRSEQSLLENRSIEGSIIMIERQSGSNRKALSEWLAHRWDPNQPNEIDLAKLALYQSVMAYKQQGATPKFKTVLPLLIDEEGPSLMSRILERLHTYFFKLYYLVILRESFSAIAVLIGCAFLTSLFLYKLPKSTAASFDGPSQNDAHRPFETNHNSKYAQKTDVSENGSTSASTSSSELKLIELKAETYNGMVRLLKPGFRSIILLTDDESKSMLLAHFRKAVWPYRRNKTLLFGYLSLDKNINWYKDLLEQVLGCVGLNVNKKNCIGTVLSLNGFKKYLRVYHVKHHEIDYYDDETQNDGSFLGFGEDDENDSYENGDVEHGKREINSSNNICSVDHLLDKLPIWLDKMFDGLTKRYFVDSWPDSLK